MAADAYKGLLTFKGIDPRTGRENGNVYQIPIDADDVAGNRIDFPQTGLEHWTAPEFCALTDIVNTEDGADTTRWELYVNGMQTSFAFILANLVGTIPYPRITAFPKFAPNATVQLYQRA